MFVCVCLQQQQKNHWDSLLTKFIRIKGLTIDRLIIFFRIIWIAFTFYSLRWNLVIGIPFCSTFFDLTYKIKIIIYKAMLRKSINNMKRKNKTFEWWKIRLLKLIWWCIYFFNTIKDIEKAPDFLVNGWYGMLCFSNSYLLFLWEQRSGFYLARACIYNAITNSM